MKAIILSILMLSTAAFAQSHVTGVYVSDQFTRNLVKTSTQALGLNKSVYFRSYPYVPLGGGSSLKAIKTIATLGAKNVTVEIRGTMPEVTEDEVFFGPFSGGVDTGYGNLVSAIQSQGMTVTFKIVLTDQTGENLVIPKSQNLARFWESYSRFVARFAKLAQKYDVDELVLGTGLGAIACRSENNFSGKKGFQDLLDEVRYYYNGRLRLDFDGYKDLVSTLPCFQFRLADIDSIGVDLPDNSDVQAVKQVLTKGVDFIQSENIDVVVSRLAFTGADQESKASAFVNDLMSLKLERVPTVTFGIADANPDKSEITDLTANIVGKPILEKIKKWFDSF